MPTAWDDRLRRPPCASALGLTGGMIYDALVVTAAEKAGAEKLVTFNPDHFRRVWPEGEALITVA